MAKLKLNKEKKSQTFSTDIIIVVVILLIGGLFVVVTKIGDVKQGDSLEEKYEEASLEANLVYEDLKSRGVITDENIVDVERLLVIDDTELKEELNIKNDFAIVFEKDGKLVKIDPEQDVNCVGSQNIVVNGITCK